MKRVHAAMVLVRRLRGSGWSCDLIASTAIPIQPGDRVKTDRRDAQALARLSAARYLEPRSVPDRAQEAFRNLIRDRVDLTVQSRRQRRRIGNFLLRHERRFHGTAWTFEHRALLHNLNFDESADQISLRTKINILSAFERRLHRAGSRYRTGSVRPTIATRNIFFARLAWCRPSEGGYSDRRIRRSERLSDRATIHGISGFNTQRTQQRTQTKVRRNHGNRYWSPPAVTDGERLDVSFPVARHAITAAHNRRCLGLCENARLGGSETSP